MRIIIALGANNLRQKQGLPDGKRHHSAHDGHPVSKIGKARYIMPTNQLMQTSRSDRPTEEIDVYSLEVTEANAALVRRYVDLFNSRADIDLFGEIFSPDVVSYVDGVVWSRGLEQMEQLWRTLYDTSDLVITIDNLLAVDNVAMFRCTHRGKLPVDPAELTDLSGVAAWKQQIWTSLSMFTFENGKIVTTMCGDLQFEASH